MKARIKLPAGAKTVLPAVAMTAVSMVLTLAVVVMWLGPSIHEGVALVVGLGIDGGWLATLAYERRLAAQGDHSNVVTGVGWCFGLIAAGVLVAHALLTADGSAAAWLAVAWLPIAAKALWLVHGLWERTALTPDALDEIRGIQQEARDQAAVDRARLRATAGTEVTRLTAVTGAGANVARVQAKTAKTLSKAWSKLETAQASEDTGRALASAACRTVPGVTPRWELPVWGPTEPVTTPSIDPPDVDSANTEEPEQTQTIRSTADLPESTPVTVTLTRLPVPDPVPADAGKSSLVLKPVPALTAPIGSTPSGSIEQRSVAADSARPAVRATYRVPESAKTPRVKRTPEQLLDEARTLTANWPQIHITGERIRKELHVSPVNARMLRDALLAERTAGAEVKA
ncbi:hypothetical protein IPZ69_05535 [Streptomyces olivochromogenes]|nr:hypothetical protein [Streptomyces olivochromogenes]